MNFRKLITYLTMGTAAAMPLAVAQNPTILQGSYISNVFGNSNFIKNPNAQTNIADVTVSNATVTRSTTTPLVATSEFLVTTSTATGSATWSTRTFDSGMKGQNCEARFSYRGFSVGSTTAQILQGANVVAQLTLTASTDPRIASINFPCGDLSSATTFRLQQATASLTGTNEIGGIYIGLATNMANVAQAENLVTAVRGTSQTIPTTTKTTFIFNSETLDQLNEYDPTTGIYTAKRPGRYLVTSTVAYTSFAWSIGNIYNISIQKNGADYVDIYNTVFAATSNNLQMQVTQTVELVTGDTIRIGLYHTRGGNTDTLASSAYNILSISRFPSSSELVVTPERQNVFGFTSGTNFDYTTKSASYVTPSGFSMDPATGRCENDGTNAACKIATLPAGRYAVQVSAPMFSAGSNGGNQSCYWGISDGIGTDVALGQTVAQNATGTFDGISSITRVFSYSSVRTNVIFKLIVKEAGTGGASANCTVATGSNNGRYWQMTVTPLDQTSNSALYVQGPVLGAQTGAAISAGYVGEKVTWTSAPSAVAFGTTVADWTNATISLNPGVWLIIANIQTFAESGTTAGNDSECNAQITDNAGTIVDTQSKSLRAKSAATGQSGLNLGIISMSTIANVTSASTVYKIRGKRTDNNGTGYCELSNSAQKQSHFYAIRIN